MSVRRPGGNHLDRKLALTPAEYAEDPHKFGRDPKVRFRIPPGGDAPSCRVAFVQHLLAVRWRARRRPSVAELSVKYGFSKQVFSKTLLGERWAGQRVEAALIADVIMPPQEPPQGR